KSIFTNVTLTDEKGNVIDANQNPEFLPSIDTAVNVNLDWSLSGLEEEGEYIVSYALPSQLIFKENQNGALLDSSGTKVGTYQIDSEGKLAILLEEDILDYAKGKFTFQANFNKEAIGDKNEADIRFELLTHDKTIKVSFQVESDDESNGVTENGEAESDGDIGQEGEGDQDSGGKMTPSVDVESADTEDTSEVVEEKKENILPASDEGDRVDQVAAEEKHGFHLELGSVADLDDKEFNDDNLLNPAELFRLKLNWNLDNKHSYKAGDTETFYLPNGIKIIDEINGELK